MERKRGDRKRGEEVTSPLHSGRSTGGLYFANSSQPLHGLHIHDTAVDENTYDCMQTGSHYDTGKTGGSHGAVNATVHHTGDLGNTEAEYDDYTGEYKTFFSVDVADKNLDVPSIIGLSLVLHSGEDDLGSGSCKTSKANGCAGSRVVCGNIIAMN